jgi:mRNA interferase MazF
MEIKRGDVVVSVASGDYGKPRPALVVQSDLFNPTHASVVICPITTNLVDAPLFRTAVKPEKWNGLKQPSQVMVDKLMAVRRERISKRIGRLTPKQMEAIDRAVRLWLSVERETEN